MHRLKKEVNRLREEFVGTAVLQNKHDAENLGPVCRVCIPGLRAAFKLWPYAVLSSRLECSEDLQKNY